MLHINDEEAAYIAGVMDGEGRLSILRSIYPYTGRYSYTVKCDISNTDRRLMSWLIVKTRLGKISEQITRSSDKTVYRWNLKTQETKIFLQTILKFLILKKERAEIVLDFIAHRRSRRSRPLTDQEAEIKEDMYYRMKLLNKRGA